MSLVGQLFKGIISGGGWTAGKAGADALIGVIKEKVSDSREKAGSEQSEEDALDDIEVAPENEEEAEDEDKKNK